MFINCQYDFENEKALYRGFEVTHSSNPELNKTFNSGCPPQDYRDARAYAIKNATDYCHSSSSVDNFVMDSDEFGWYTDAFGTEWFDYLDKLDGLELAAAEEKASNMESLVFYFQNTLRVNDAFANALAESTYNEFGKYIMPMVLEYRASVSKD